MTWKYKQKHRFNMQFRDYQVKIIDQGVDIISRYGFVYLAMEVRTGKTLTSLGIASKIKAKHVLFVTKKKAMSSIRIDYEMYAPDFYLDVINYESLHKVKGRYDLIILDEAHGLGAFPKPSGRAKKVRELYNKNHARVILMSGTPTPESYCQLFHQVYFLPNNPFYHFKNFYAFARVLVVITQRKFGGYTVNDYKDGKKIILDRMNPYMISYTQKQAGFEVTNYETILDVEMKTKTYYFANKLKKDLVIQGEKEVVLADTAVKLMSKLHQIYSGTVKFESGKSQVIDYTKAEFINQKFNTNKIGIFYKFKEEYNALKRVYQDKLTNDLDEFNSSDKSIALQIVSGREGISLKLADFLVYYNIDFSATSYWQSKDRMTTKQTKTNHIYWVFSKGGIEKKIYNVVAQKKKYTTEHFKRDFINI